MNTDPPVILVVEDDSDIVEVLAALLPFEGYTVAIARTGADAIDQLHQHAPDLMLSDLHLSQGNCRWWLSAAVDVELFCRGVLTGARARPPDMCAG